MRLAGIRFAQAGMPAEVYADDPDQLEYVLRFVPEHSARPVVHLNRRLNLLDPGGQAAVRAFTSRFAGRVHGLVVHDRREMRDRMPEVRDVLSGLGTPRPGEPPGPVVLLEYAAGLELDWYVELAGQLAGIERAGCCVDIGHVGIRLSQRALADARPELASRPLTPRDPRLPDLLPEVEAASRAALPAVLELLRGLGAAGTRTHLHLHDGHVLVPGLSDHFSFLTRIPVPFAVDGRSCLDPLYGPVGLASILRCATGAFPAGAITATLEIHQVEGRLPLPPDEVSGLFGRWRDLTNAERMNYWLSVLADNHLLAQLALAGSIHG